MYEIKRGDRLNAKVGGHEVLVEAASGVKDGTLQIKYKGAFTTISAADVRPAAGEEANTDTPS